MASLQLVAEALAASVGWVPADDDEPTPRPELLVEISLTKTPTSDTVTTAYFKLDTDVLDTGVLGDKNSWTDVTDDVNSVNINIGRNDSLSEVSVGTGTIVLDNSMGQYNADNPASPYFAGDEAIIPARQVRVRAMWAGYNFVLFRGYVEDFDYDHSSSPTVSISLIDNLGFLAAINVPALGSATYGEKTGARINRMAAIAQLPDSLRELDTGVVTMPSTKLGATALALAQQAALAELGLLFASKDGVLTFYARDHLESDPRSVEVQTVFSDSGENVEYDSFQTNYGLTETYNEISVTRSADGAVTQTVNDTDSIAKYGKRNYNVDGLEVATDYEAQFHGLWLLARYKDPSMKIKSFTVELLHQPQYFAKVASLRLWDRVQVIRTYEGGYQFIQSVWLEGLSIDISRDAWTFTFNTSRVAGSAYDGFILDTDHLDDGTKGLGL